MKKKQGISLIVLVITIIVMVILAASAVITLSNSGIIEKANEATETTDVKSIQQEAEVVKLLEFGTHITSKNAHEERFNKIILINKLLEHFKGSTKQGDGIVTADGKYNIIVGEDLTIIVTSNSNTKVKKGDVKLNLAYDNSEKTLPLTVYITPTIEGWTAKGESYSSYEEYAEAVLATVKTDAELEQIFVDGQNYWIKENNGGFPLCDNIEQLVAFVSENFDNNAYTTVEGMVEHYGFASLREMAISVENVKPEGYYRSYREYTEEIFKTTTKTYEQLYMEGSLYWAKVNESSHLNELRNAKSFEEFVSIHAGIDNIKSVEELKDYANENWGYELKTAKEFLINWDVVEPEAFNTSDGMVVISCSDGQKMYAMTGETVEFTVSITGNVTFKATAYNGKQKSETITIEGDLPAFTIEGENGTKSFAYIQGMTWQEWLESDMNTLTTSYTYIEKHYLSYVPIYITSELGDGQIYVKENETVYKSVEPTDIMDLSLDYWVLIFPE